MPSRWRKPTWTGSRRSTDRCTPIARSVSESLLTSLAAIKDNSADSQVAAALNAAVSLFAPAVP